VDIGRCFTYVFEDRDWLKKVLIGAVLMLTGIGMIPVIGYGIEVARRVVKGNPQLLPEWDEWGTRIVEGFLTMAIGFIWALPLILVSSCIWIILVPVAGVDESGTALGWVGIIASVCVGLVSLIYGLLLFLVLPAAIMRYATTGQFSAAFRIGEVIGLVRSNLSLYLMVMVVSILANIVGSLGGVVVGCGAYFTLFYAVLITYHAYGQAHRLAAGNVENEVQLSY